MVNRLLLGLALPTWLIFTLIIALIRAQPYDDGELRALLLPDGCPAPCFMAIRPGFTSPMLALAILEDHPWVGQVKVSNPIREPNTFYVSWSWSGQQPGLIDSRKRGALHIVGGEIHDITVQTVIPNGAVWLLLGGTNSGTALLSPFRPDRDLVYVAAYLEPALLARTTIARQARNRAFWETPIELEATHRRWIDYLRRSEYALPCWLACQ